MAGHLVSAGQLALQLAMADVGVELINLAVWVKTNGGMGSRQRIVRT